MPDALVLELSRRTKGAGLVGRHPTAMPRLQRGGLDPMSHAVIAAAHERKDEIVNEAPRPVAWLLEGWPALLFVAETWVSMFLGFVFGVFAGGAVL
jgi:hypothetical protein